MPIITLSREMGSRGDDIALAVAQRLKLRLAGRALINRAAKEAGAPEVALAEIDELGLLGVKPSPTAQQLYREKVTAVIFDLFSQGDVLLVGRGGQIVLADRPGVLHVLAIAPREMRARVVQERCRVSPEVAAARIDASDRARAGFLKRYHGIRWGDPRLYDLVLNMAHLNVATAVDLVCLAAERIARLEEAPQQSEPAPEGEGCECR
jgi:cytidylate kinase